MYCGWYDPDKKKPTKTKLDDAIERYVEKFGEYPEEALVNSAAVAEIGEHDLIITGVNYIPVNTFYVGNNDEIQHG